MKIVCSSNLTILPPLPLICLTLPEFWDTYRHFHYKIVIDEIYGTLTYFFTDSTLHACHPHTPQSKFCGFSPSLYEGPLPKFKGIITIGTPFQRGIWQHLLEIPKGQTKTYGQIAKELENPKAARAVGQAVGANPVSVHIPCHRVLAAHGKLGGFHWGSDLKEKWLLKESISNNINSSNL